MSGQNKAENQKPSKPPVDIRARFYALHGLIGKGGLTPLATRADLPRLERGLLALMASVEGAYEGAKEASEALRGKGVVDRYRITGKPVKARPTGRPPPRKATEPERKREQGPT